MHPPWTSGCAPSMGTNENLHGGMSQHLSTYMQIAVWPCLPSPSFLPQPCSHNRHYIPSTGALPAILRPQLALLHRARPGPAPAAPCRHARRLRVCAVDCCGPGPGCEPAQALPAHPCCSLGRGGPSACEEVLSRVVCLETCSTCMAVKLCTVKLQAALSCSIPDLSVCFPFLAPCSQLACAQGVGRMP